MAYEKLHSYHGKIIVILIYRFSYSGPWITKVMEIETRQHYILGYFFGAGAELDKLKKQGLPIVAKMFEII